MEFQNGNEALDLPREFKSEKSLGDRASGEYQPEKIEDENCDEKILSDPMNTDLQALNGSFNTNFQLSDSFKKHCVEVLDSGECHFQNCVNSSDDADLTLHNLQRTGLSTENKRLDLNASCNTNQSESFSTENIENSNSIGISQDLGKSDKMYDVSDGTYKANAGVKTGVNLYESSSAIEIRNRHKRNNENSYSEVCRIRDVEVNNSENIYKKPKVCLSLLHYLKVEVTRGYLFEEQGDKYTEQREKVYTFMKTPRELEKLMWFGFLLCLDCFLFVFTYLPVRLLLALLRLLGNVVCLRFLKNGHSLLEPDHICDLLRGLILIVCCIALDNVDLSILYHIVRGQSVIKLYVIYNMLDIADRLFSSIGQDTLDALFWTAAEAKQRRSIVMVLLHFGLASIYVYLHAVLVLFQAITLNVAINSHNKVLMVVMISNQFVELKGCVFKKFEKNNLFQMSCADIRERFYYVVLVSLVALRNMHELQWNLDHLYELLPSIGLLLSSEVFVDWVKHAFITKFNCISSEVYREYRELLARDATTSRLFEQRARSDHFDLVSRRLGFIPLPLGCLVYRVTSQSVKISGVAGVIVLALTYLWLMSVKVLNSVILLGMSCQHVIDKEKQDSRKMNNYDEDKHSVHSKSTPDQQHLVSDPLDRDPKKQTKPTGVRKVKPLNEIDRYTLCSNRIV